MPDGREGGLADLRRPYPGRTGGRFLRELHLRPDATTAPGAGSTRTGGWALLHLRHHGQSQGRALLAPLQLSAHHDEPAGRRAGAVGAPTACCWWCPMFHANAWGLAFSGPAVGAKLVLPGAKMDGASICELWRRGASPSPPPCPPSGRCCCSTCRRPGPKLHHLKQVVIGGSACPEAIIRTFNDDYGVEVLHLWGMTETSPVGSVGVPCSTVAALPFDEQMAYRLKQGRVPLGVDMKLEDDDGQAAAARRRHLRPAEGARATRSPGPISRARAATSSTTRASSTPATWRPSTSTATCRSPTAPRT